MFHRGARARTEAATKHHMISQKQIEAIQNRLEEEAKTEAKKTINKAIAKMNGYFMLANLFPRVHENTPKFIYETEQMLNDSELHILFFSMAVEPVYAT